MPAARHSAAPRAVGDIASTPLARRQMMERLLLKRLQQSAVALASLQAGCILAPPIETEPQPRNHPPHIWRESVRPQDEIIFASGANDIELAVDAVFDQDEEEVLDFAWYIPTLGRIETGKLDLVGSVEEIEGTDESELGIFYQYEETSYTISPCDSELSGRQSVTVWFYVSDRNWEGTSSTGVTTAPGAFLTSWAWVIDLSNATCD